MMRSCRISATRPIGLVNACPYTIDLETDANNKFIAAMMKEYDVLPRLLCRRPLCQRHGGRGRARAPAATSEDKEAIKALRAVVLADTPRGPIRFDHFGNVIGNFYVRKIEKVGGKLTNVTHKTYQNVSQFWTYDETKSLAQPVYSRD